MAVHRLYVGANNTTKEVAVDSLKAILNAYFEGYSLLPAEGMWKGTPEKSVVLEIQTDEVGKVKDLIAVLKDKLEQQAIGYQVLPEMSFV